jgi:hypothetical protein
MINVIMDLTQLPLPVFRSGYILLEVPILAHLA